MTRKEALIEIKGELEDELAQIEKQRANTQSALADLERKLLETRVKIDAVNTLLGSSIGTDGGPGSSKPSFPVIKEPVGVLSSPSPTEEVARSNILRTIQSHGWSVSKRSGRYKTVYSAEKTGRRLELKIQFSKYEPAQDSFWYGIPTSYYLELTVKRSGGVILLLEDEHVCLPFGEIRKLLLNATSTKTGKKFKVRKRGDRIELQPTGNREDWQDVTRFQGLSGLRALGIVD